ncbi:MAG: threonine-phosphate decarboxylase, partial [Pseudomonadota bacterium]
MTVRSYPSSNPRDAPQRDHGGGLDAAISLFGGDRDDWLDLSTGINPQPYPVAGLTQADWQFLP